MRHPENWEARPRPEGHLFTVVSVALFLRRNHRTVQNILAKHRDRFDEPIYQQVYRDRGNMRFYRVLTEHDMRVIREMFPVYTYVKKKVGRPK
jgi:hypothetical protein